MKLFTGWVMSAGLVLTAATANAQAPASRDVGGSPYRAVSDFDGPYAAMPPEAPVPPAYGHYGPNFGPRLLPPQEVYTVVRESGFSPLGIPRQRGIFYVIAVIDRRGDDGRLVIDARTGQVVRFVPAYRAGGNFDEGGYAPAAPLSPMSNFRGPPRPPASVPQVASRMPATVPMPKASPSRAGEARVDAKPLAETPAAGPAPLKSAAMQTKPADTPAAPQAAATVATAKPAPQIQPTQPMPQVQGLE